MLQPSTPSLSDGDYDALEAAISETARGRAFLAEYARRARVADTRLLTSALERIEGSRSSPDILMSGPVEALPEKPAIAPDPWVEIKSMSEEEKLAMFS
jgi:hypothetical protein